MCSGPLSLSGVSTLTATTHALRAALNRTAGRPCGSAGGRL
jgi:hypothetical protein